MSFDLLLPKTKAISIAIVYKPPTDNDFLEFLSKGLNDFNLMENDTNTNILNNGETCWMNIKTLVKENLILMLFLERMHKFVLL